MHSYSLSNSEDTLLVRRIKRLKSRRQKLGSVDTGPVQRHQFQILETMGCPRYAHCHLFNVPEEVIWGGPGSNNSGTNHDLILIIANDHLMKNNKAG